MNQSIVQNRDVSFSVLNADAVQYAELTAQGRVSHQGIGFQGGVGVYGGQGYGLTDGLRHVRGSSQGIRVVEGMPHDSCSVTPFVPSPMPIATPPFAPLPPNMSNVPPIPMSKAVGAIQGDVRGGEFSGIRSVGSGDFQTPRESSTGKWGISADGYPEGGQSSATAVIQDRPIAPEAVYPSYRDPTPYVSPPGKTSPTQADRPEEPAKYISEIPKLPSADISTSAVVCGNWLAQLRQIFVGLSPSANTWRQAVELASNRYYQKWLIADPLDRLSLDPKGVIAIFDEAKFQRVESRAVSLILAAIPQHIRDEAVSNRWLSTAAFLFRLQCVYQPGGASERSMWLSQRTLPKIAGNPKSAVAMLRKWQQNFYRVHELGASMPDPSLLLAGIDKATVGLLGQHHSLGFRVNAFRHKVALDYNPTVTSIVQLVRLIQAECEALALSTMDAIPPDKKARAAAARAEASADSTITKAIPPSKPEDPSAPPSAKALEGNDKGNKGKGKGKGKNQGTELSPCFNFNEAKGCKFGDSCRFKHDRATARKQKRCLACGQEGHFRPDCPLVAPEDRQVIPQSDASSPASPKATAKASSPSRPKSAAQIKGVTEEASSSGEPLGPTRILQLRLKRPCWRRRQRSSRVCR